MIRTKEELMYGDIVQIRGGGIGMIMRAPMSNGAYIVFQYLYDDLDYYFGNMHHRSELSFDIVKAVRPKTPYYMMPAHWDRAIKDAKEGVVDNGVELLYKETPFKEMTLKEIEDRLGFKIRIVEK